MRFHTAQLGSLSRYLVGILAGKQGSVLKNGSYLIFIVSFKLQGLGAHLLIQVVLPSKRNRLRDSHRANHGDLIRFASILSQGQEIQRSK